MPDSSRTGPARPLTLAIDTASLVSVGLAADQQVLAAEVIADPRGHVEQLTPLVQRVVANAGVRLGDLDRIVVGLGPGPYTGLRVGIVTARILSAVTGAELRGVCSLDVIAVAHEADESFVVATDARRREVYWAEYGADGRRIDGPHVSAPVDVPHRPVVGPAVDLHPDILRGAPGPRALDPAVLAARGWDLAERDVEGAADLRPLYLRRPDAVESTQRKSVLPRQRAQLQRRGRG